MSGYPGYIPPARQTIATAVAHPGWPRYRFLAMLIQAMGWTRGVEIGVSFGDTFGYLLAECPRLELTGVDTFALNPDAPEPPDWTADHHIRARAAAEAIAARYPNNAALEVGRSTDVAQEFAPGSLDFVWIDGDHATEALLADIAAWSPALKPDGWLLGHDVNWPTVRAAVDQVLPGYLVGPDSVWFRPLHPAPGWWAGRFGGAVPGPA